jgi:hypothetical protein
MTDIDRRTINELVARYELEPSLNDVFVEGVFDKEIFSSAMSGDNKKCAIYDIGTVDVPNRLLSTYDLTEGNKQRVLALAKELAKISQECSYICLVDKDLDHWFGKLDATKRLRWTQYCAIELHFFCEDFLRHFLVTTCRLKVSNFDKFLQSLTSVLSYLYAMRLADSKLLLKLKWISFDRSLSRQGDLIIFSIKDYAKRLLLSNKKGRCQPDFLRETESFYQRLKGDCRDHIRGHDFTEILVWVIQNFCKIQNFSSPETIERIFVHSARTMPHILKEIA